MEDIEDKIKNILIEKLKGSKYDKANIMLERVKQLLNIHRSWIIFAKFKQTPEQMAQALYQYELNLSR
jgi:predicted small secreted protein